MKPPYEAMLERLRRAGVPEEMIQAVLHDDRFGHDLQADQRVTDGLIEAYRAGLVRIDPDGLLRFTERGRRAARKRERRRRDRSAQATMHPISVSPELVRRLNALFPGMQRVVGEVLRVDDQVLAKIRKYQQPGETESDVIHRFLDTWRDGQLEELMRGIS